MRRTILALSVTLALGIAMGVGATGVLSAQGDRVRRTEILSTDLAGLEGKEGHMWVAVIPPGEATGKHYHPGYEFIYTLDGTGIIQEEGKPAVAIKPGAAFDLRSSSDRAEYVHEAKNTGTIPIKLLVVLISDRGQPMVKPLK
jgi:quercetin dioxygenase-like cupin family protein